MRSVRGREVLTKKWPVLVVEMMSCLGFLRTTFLVYDLLILVTCVFID